MISVRSLAFLILSLVAFNLPATAQDSSKPLFDGSTPPELLWNEGEFTEGVAAAPDGQIFFSDIASSRPGRILKFDPGTKKVTVFVAESGKSNGLTFDARGTLIAACGANGGRRAVCEVSASGHMTPLLTHFEGRRLNAPNDLDIHPQGWIYFSDPRYGGGDGLELDQMSVYRFDPKTNSTERVTQNISKPNGVVIAPDGRSIYVAETDNASPPLGLSQAGQIRMTLNAFPIDAQGRLGARKVLHDFGKETGVDGMTVDAEGRIFAAVRAESRFGIGVYDPRTGAELAFLKTPETPTNCGFGREVKCRRSTSLQVNRFTACQPRLAAGSRSEFSGVSHSS